VSANFPPAAFNLRPKAAWFLAFTAAFALLAGFVFWGTWSPDAAPVMPDDVTVHSLVYGDYLDKALRKLWTAGKFIPSDILWDGLLFSPYFCQELKYAFALFCAGLGLAYYCRGRGLSHVASYGSGLLLAFCGYWSTLFSAGHGGWFIWMTYGVFAFGLIDRAVRKDKLRSWLLLGACVAWSSFYQPDLWFLFAVFTALYFAWCCFRERRLPWKGALVSLAVFALVGLPSFFDAVANKKGRDEMIAKGETVAPGAAKDEKDNRWIFVTNWSLPADETAEFFIPRLNGDTSCPLTLSVGLRHGTGIRPYTGALGRPKDAPSGNYRQHSLYVGWMTCLLAALGCFAGFRGLRGPAAAAGRNPQASTVGLNLRSDILFFFAAAVLFWLLSLGRYCEPVYRIVFSLPVGDTMRCPVKWHHLTELALCVLAAYGLEWLRGMKGFRGLRGTVILSAVVLLGAYDLARVDKLFCAPVDLRQVRKTNSAMQMSVLRRQDFANPQVAEMVNRGHIVSLANYLGNPDLYLVEMLTPRKPAGPRAPLPPMTAKTWIGFLSLLCTVAVGAFAALSCLRKDGGPVRGPTLFRKANLI